MDAGDSWYSVRLLVEIVVDEGRQGASLEDRRFEDRILVVRSADKDSARAKGAHLAESDNTEYLNVDGERVQWLYRQVIDVHELASQHIEDGTEVYSAFVNGELAEVLRAPEPSPLDKYRSAHPDANVNEVRAGDVLDLPRHTDQPHPS
ncbi:MAG TPA: DUF4288 domain-containing protein [Acidimicrobiales bacterium]|nr:DUF4288 domain-containing protein [Acidimicrobiales bacterium]